MLLGKTADVYLTGEMSHVRLYFPLLFFTFLDWISIKHEVLAAVSSGTHVILCEFISFSN